MGGSAQPGAPSLTNQNLPQGGGLRPGQSAFPGGAGFGGYDIGGFNVNPSNPMTPPQAPVNTGQPVAPQMPQGAPNYAALAGGRMPGLGGPVPQAPNVGGGMPNYAQALQGMFGRR